MADLVVGLGATKATWSAAFRFPRHSERLADEILQRQFLFTTRAPCRKVIFAFGQRWHAAK